VRIESSSGSAPGRVVIAISIGLVIVIWSVNFVAAKIGLRSLPTLTMASFRVVFAGVVMIPAYLLCSRLGTFAESAETRRRGFTLRDLWIFLYLGFFGVAVNQFCFTAALRLTSVSHASVIVGMGPIYTLALAVLLRLEKATLRKATGMAIAFAGIAVMASENGLSAHSPSLLGDAITLAGSVGFAIYLVLGKQVAGKYDALTMTAFSHFAGALIVLPLAIRQAAALGPVQSWFAIPWSAWASLSYMAIFSSAVAYILYYWLLRYLEASQLAAFSYLLPVLATILGITWLGEKGSWGQVLGGLLAFGGVYWTESARTSAARTTVAS
jgi:drug/metabolite transporter (DMT)-like permease